MRPAMASSVANMAGKAVPNATRAAPVSVAKSMMTSGDASAANASASHSISRPSASVLSISMVVPS